MANELRTTLTNDASQFNQSMQEATSKVEKFQDKIDDAKHSVDDLGKKGAISTKELLKEIGKMSGAEKNLYNYRKQLSQMTKDIQDLTISYRSMTEEQKNSDTGQAALQRISELTQKAAEYRDAIQDAQQSIKAISSDTFYWDAAKQGIDTVSSALQGVVATGMLGEKTTEAMVDALGKLKAAETLTNTAIKVGTALQKNSNIMTAISTLQTKALAKAKNLEAVATGKATIAQKIFNTICRANPYIILATAILAVVTAIGAWTLATRKHNDATADAKKIQDGYNKAIKEAGEAAGNDIGKFVLLEQQYKKLKTEAEKQTWIAEHKKAFEDLGYSIGDVNTADEVFIEHAKDVIKAMRLRAEAAAIMEEYQRQYAEAYKKQLELENKGKKSPNNGAPQLNNQNIKKAGLKYGEDYTTQVNPSPVPGGVSMTTPVLTPEGERKWKEYWESQGEAATEAVVEGMSGAIKLMEDKIAEAEKLDSKWRVSSNPSSGGNGGPSKEEQERKQQEEAMKKLKSAQKELIQLKIDYEKIDKSDTVAIERAQKKIVEQEQVVERLKKGIKDKSTIVESELSLLREYKKDLEDQLPHIQDGSKEWEKQISIINNVDKKIKDLEEAVESYKNSLNRVPLENLEPVQTKLNAPTQVESPKMTIEPVFAEDKLRGVLEAAQKAADKVQERFDLGLIDAGTAKILVQNINESLKSYGIRAEVSIDVNYGSLNQAIGEIKQKIESIADVVTAPIQAINSVVNAFDQMNDKLDDPDASGWEQFFAVFQAGMSVIDAVSTVMGVLQGVTELLNGTKERSAAASLKEATASAAAGGAAATEAGEKLADAGATGALTAAKAGESVASIPVAGAFMAPIAIATVLAALLVAITSLSKFETGGVVGGNSYSGDKILARLNSGELILNQKQQKNLWKQMNQNVVSYENYVGINIPDKITLTAHGRDLQAALTNINKYNSKI